LVALGHLLNGDGYDPEVSLVQEVFGHLRDAASRIGARDWAKQQVRALVDGPCDSSRKHFQSALAQCLARCSEERLETEPRNGAGMNGCGAGKPAVVFCRHSSTCWART
jgi:hypothetical protein